MRRVLATCIMAALALGTFALSALVGLWLHLDLAITRLALRDVINLVLSDTFAGTVRLGGFERLDEGGIALVDFHADDPDGRRVLEVDKLQLRGTWLHALW